MPDSPEVSPELSAELVRKIRSGETSAWEALYLRYRDRLLLSIRCRLGPRLRARLQSEDILHSVMRDAMEDLAHFESREKGGLEHYLHICALNKIRTKAEFFATKKRAGERPLTDSILANVASPTGAEPGYRDPRFERLEAGLKVLPQAFREILILRKIENLSNQEAAKALGKTPQAATKLYNRALGRLGVLLGADAKK